jgi:RecB family exonuclease
VITPRRTRLVRVADLHAFRRTVGTLLAGAARGSPPGSHATRSADSTVVVVPTRAAGVVLRNTLHAAGVDHPPLVATRDQLYDVFHDCLGPAPRRLSAFELDAMALGAAEEAAKDIPDLPFRIRPGLVAELARFHAHLRRQSQTVARFEALVVDALGVAGDSDVGAARLLQQTRFLARAFASYEQRVRQSGGCDEHLLREHLLIHGANGVRSVVVTVPDWIADPTGLFVADFDLLARMPGLEALDLVCTEAVLGSGFHERLHNWWPGLEETEGSLLVAEPSAPVRPRLMRPEGEGDERLWFTYRDREEELVALARRLSDPAFGGPPAWQRTAIVYKQPLPYLYLAPGTLGKVGVACQTFDAFPLATEPLVAAVDLVLDAVETRFSREALVALLSAPVLGLGSADLDFRRSVSDMNALLSRERYLGGVDRLKSIAGPGSTGPGAAALTVAIETVRELVPLTQTARASEHLTTLADFLDRHWRVSAHSDRERDACETVMGILHDLAAAHDAHHDPAWAIDDLIAAVRRAIENELAPQGAGFGVLDAGSVRSAGDVPQSGVHLLDDQAARYGEFDDIAIVGLVENEWPERSRRNIFYAPGILKALGWPSEKDRRAAADARFVDLLRSASSRVELSTFLLEDEALVTRSLQLDEVPRAQLSTVSREPEPVPVPESQADTSPWASLRHTRSTPADPRFHGGVGPGPRGPWSVSALETYLGCPFKFYAQHVLKLEEEPDDEEVMDPRRQGQFVHEVFEQFFEQWQAAGRREVTAAALETARALFVQVVDRALDRLPEGEGALERTRLLGSPAAAGLGEAVFRMEIERTVPVVERLLEHSLSGRFTFQGADGPREIELRGKADRVDLLADGTFRLVDYKLGWPPDKNRALQLPIYGACAEQRLAGYRGQHWTLAEAVYLAFKGPRRVVPLFLNERARDEVLAKAGERLLATVDAVARGEFPPSPDDVFRCETCSFQAVCRKDYVGDV